MELQIMYGMSTRDFRAREKVSTQQDSSVFPIREVS